MAFLEFVFQTWPPVLQTLQASGIDASIQQCFNLSAATAALNIILEMGVLIDAVGMASAFEPRTSLDLCRLPAPRKQCLAQMLQIEELLRRQR